MKPTTPEAWRQAFLINLASSSLAQVSAFVLSLLLARLLTPAELGVYALAALLAGFAHLLRDFGISTYLQRQSSLDREQLASCFGFLLVTGFSSAALLALAGDPLARYYAMPELADTLQVLALGFLLLPFSTLVAALQQRELAASRIALVARLGGTAHALTALVLAWQGWGPLSLAWASVAAIVVCSLAHLRLKPADFDWRPSTRHWQPLLHFGSGSMLGSLANQLNQALPGLLLGRLGGPTQLGLYARASTLAQLFTALAGPAMSFGALPKLAEQHHTQRPLAPLLLQATALLTGVAWPVLALAAVFGEDLLGLLYGPAWLGAAPAIPALALAAALALPFHYLGTALSATGRPGLAVWPPVFSLLLRLALLYWLVVADAASMAWLLMFAGLLGLPLLAWLQQRWLGISWRSLARALQASLLVLLSCLATACLLLQVLSGLASTVRLMLALPVLLAVWLLSLQLSGHPLAAQFQGGPRRFITIRK
ncbi:oligosaccharide flippase family protein [Pelomonas sp. SE-A7]|uniref:oligosaccharide flippase family protein n=1 Tax=Pelomonas sp. SE-A7 TaxID=3054953 RepID=UPI00259CAA19|nr:oligosaccharide flippase family protein [Pelomonas sp. SE-A7]MDM4765395.1 oligosaccharide flippase family protein [Pelomonas sp. SE-A7]